MLDELRAQFLPEFAAGARARLRTAIALIPPLGPGGEDSARSIAALMHTIAGEAMLIGYPELAQLARTAGEAARGYLSTSNDARLVACARSLRTLSRAIEVLEASPSPTPTPSSPIEPVVPDRIRVLVVDDSPLNGALLREGLTSEGFETAAVHDDFERVLRQMETMRPQVLLVDWFMPGCDTGKLCRHIQSTPELSQTHILLVTSLPEAEANELARSLGIAGAVSKEQGIPSIGGRIRELTERTT